MALSRMRIVAYLTVVLGVALVYSGFAFTVTAVPNVQWAYLWQFPYGILFPAAGLFLYGEALWWMAARHDKTSSSGSKSE